MKFQFHLSFNQKEKKCIGMFFTIIGPVILAYYLLIFFQGVHPEFYSFFLRSITGGFSSETISGRAQNYIPAIIILLFPFVLIFLGIILSYQNPVNEKAQAGQKHATQIVPKN
jgi:NADH:ubiquinone oxidoreductase subunit 6 (subunit J)